MRLLAGVLIVLFVLVANIMAAFIESGIADWDAGSAEGGEFANCSEGNYTDCDNVGKTSFFSTLADVSFSGFDGAPAIVNALWLTTMGLLLTTAILLIAVSFIPTTSA